MGDIVVKVKNFIFKNIYLFKVFGVMYVEGLKVSSF